MIYVEGDPDSVAGDVLDVLVGHDGVNGTIPDEVADYVVHDPLLGNRVECDSKLPEELLNRTPEVGLPRLDVHLLRHLQVLDDQFLENSQQLLLLGAELRLDDLVEVLVCEVVVEDSHVGVVVDDRLSLDLLHVRVGYRGYLGDLPRHNLLPSTSPCCLDLQTLLAEHASIHPAFEPLKYTDSAGHRPSTIKRDGWAGHVDTYRSWNPTTAMRSMMKEWRRPFTIFPLSRTPARIPSPTA